MNQDWFAFVQQMQYTIQNQQQKLEELEKALQAMKAELEDVKRNPPSSIGKVEYKFDQLKVENLNGTLNIGLNPFVSKGQMIEDFDVDTETLKVNPETQINPDFYQDIMQEMNRYLNEEAYSRIVQLENNERIPLDDMYRQMMIDDIRKQMEHRLPYYLSQVQPYPEITSNQQYMKEVITQNMKQDIDKAFIAFIQHLPHHMRKEE
ncbi:spore germination protein GerPC [Ectobacillus panaciterrae]|uniref:spore germination protein GerPC n=1 Tax=Ectobacillus panaciterrae TaxID=363872 RepID=UPI00040B4FC0|nr:spore germination protein GerPC [Ectobacillus panaciterrae]